MTTNILMPALSPTMEEGKLARWLVKEGDEVHSGDILAEIETDKATMEFEAVDEGKIGKILVAEGTEGVKVNQPIAVLLEDGESADDASSAIDAAMASIKSAVSAESGPTETPKTEAPKAPAPAPAPKPAPAPVAAPAPAAKAPSTEGRVFASPLARRLAAQSGIDLAAVTGTGPRGRVVKVDVEAAAKSGTGRAAAKAPAAAAAGAPGVAALPDARLFYKPEDIEEIPHDSMRKAIARRLTSATSLIPHFYLTIECNIDTLMATRARMNAAAPKGDGGKPAYKLSVNDFIVKASAMALKRVPEVNASWTDDAVLRHKHADVGVAVALDFGLITPIVFAAEEKGLAQISNSVKELAGRAKSKQLKPQEFEGGSFAISNLGMFGIKEFTAVINPPHAAILAVGAGEQRAIVHDGKIEAATMMTVTLSCDHRVIDGATGARFLQVLKTFLEDPASMLL
jgi:pyruvate dehydrogenase E2 component (dihydrolipoamide acetyltransferase)